MITMSAMLPDIQSVRLTDEGVRHVAHGRDVGPDDWAVDRRLPDPVEGTTLFKLVGPTGELLALARPAARVGLLHPSVVLV